MSTGYRFTVAKHQPIRIERNREACDECVGRAIGKFGNASVEVEDTLSDKRHHGYGLDDVLLVNAFLPRIGTHQFTLCREHQLYHQVKGITSTTIGEV